MNEIFLFRDYLSNFNSTGVLILRLIAGICLLMHGLPKAANPMNWMGDQFPGVLQLMAVLFEVVGGLALIIGLFVPLFSIGIAITMFVAFMVHLSSSEPILRLTVKGSSEGIGNKFSIFPKWFVLADGKSAFGSGSAELALLFLAIAICLFFVGSGKWSIDYLLFGLKK
ncbi:MAG: DoxX family protein [Sphingobacterium sp.]|uniref:DoxX family protein n=1 Tax=Sphingobacterium sp. JB170 TaxID=1434842 RepID=UPI00097EBDE5|nr:DoxX family protein [Sphingobacterium sp. JB170]SJN23164.1 hypothetical protein FM107_03760 [Sphingobacterium sp. JB170]